MRQKGRMEMDAMFSLLSFLYFAYISACFTPQTKGIRKYQIARYNVVQTCIQYSTPKTLIFERKCHSVADLRERSPPPPPGGGGSGRFPVKKKISFCEWRGGEE